MKNPVHVKDLCKYEIEEISFGSHHTTILTSSGHVLSMGSNNMAQFGYGNTKVRDLVTMAKGLEDEQISVSGFHIPLK